MTELLKQAMLTQQQYKDNEMDKKQAIVNTLFGDRIGINSFAQPLRDAKNICTSTYFNLYFIQAVPQGVISNTVINAVYTGFNSLSDTDLGKWIKKFNEEYDEGEMQRAILSILRLEKDLQNRDRFVFIFNNL